AGPRRPAAAVIRSTPRGDGLGLGGCPRHWRGGVDMTLTRQTMTDEQRKSVALEYLKAFDKGGVTSDGGSILDLFADDAQVYFPKWGVASGREQIGQLFGDVGGSLTSIEHHFSHFTWLFSGVGERIGHSPC